MKKRESDIVGVRPDDPAGWPEDLSAPVAGLLHYWISKCVRGRYPRRADIAPGEIRDLLPYLYIVERLAGPQSDYLFRLVGTEIVKVEGECTGQRLSELFPDRGGYAAIWRQYDDACRGRIRVRYQDLGWKGKKHIDYETVLLPLRGDHKRSEEGDVAFLIGVAYATSLD